MTTLGAFFDWQQKHGVKPVDVAWGEEIRVRIVADLRRFPR